MNPIILNHFGRRAEFIQMLKEREAKVGVEIGTDKGAYASDICYLFPEVKLYTIDPWQPYTEGNEIKDQIAIDAIYAEAQRRLSFFPNCEIIRNTSMEAVKNFEDNSLDFVFIDGNHEYDYVFEDITEWTKKVKPGGIIAGHDYKEDEIKNYGVVRAVKNYTILNHVAPLFILRKGGTFVDCWLFFKQ